jgi:hypothetical protein
MAERVPASLGDLIAGHDPQFVPLAAIRHNKRRWRGRAGEVAIRSAAQCRADMTEDHAAGTTVISTP